MVLNRLVSCQQVELESIKSEYTNAQLECNAADERAKLLASEVIGLEEKVLNFVGMFCHLNFLRRKYKFSHLLSEIKFLTVTYFDFCLNRGEAFSGI